MTYDRIRDIARSAVANWLFLGLILRVAGLLAQQF